MGIFIKLWGCYQQESMMGIIRSFLRLVRRIRRRIWYKKQYYIFTKSIQNETLVGEHTDVVFRLANEDDIPAITRQLRYIYSDEHFLQYLFSTGDQAVIGLSAEVNQKKIMYISWLSREDKLFLTLLGKQSNSSNICHKRIWVPYEFRRRGLAARGIQYAQWQASRRGENVVWAFVETGNKISRKIHQILAYEEYGQLMVGSYLGFRFARTRRANEKDWQSLSVKYL